MESRIYVRNVQTGEVISWLDDGDWDNQNDLRVDVPASFPLVSAEDQKFWRD